MDRSKSLDNEITNTNKSRPLKLHRFSSKLPSRHLPTRVEIKPKPILNSERSVITTRHKLGKPDGFKQKTRSKSTTEIEIKPPPEDTEKHQNSGGLFKFLPSFNILGFKQKYEQTRSDETEDEETVESNVDNVENFKYKSTNGDVMNKANFTSNIKRSSRVKTPQFKKSDCSINYDETTTSQTKSNKSCLKPAGRSLSTPIARQIPFKKDFTVRFGSEVRKIPVERIRLQKTNDSDSEKGSFCTNSKSLPNFDRFASQCDGSSVDNSLQHRNKKIVSYSKEIKTKKGTSLSQLENDSFKHDWMSKASTIAHDEQKKVEHEQKMKERRKQAERIHIDRRNKIKLKKIEEQKAEMGTFRKYNTPSKNNYSKLMKINKDSEDMIKIDDESDNPVKKGNKNEIKSNISEDKTHACSGKTSKVNRGQIIPTESDVTTSLPVYISSAEESNDEPASPKDEEQQTPEPNNECIHSESIVSTEESNDESSHNQAEDPPVYILSAEESNDEPASPKVEEQQTSEPNNESIHSESIVSTEESNGESSHHQSEDPPAQEPDNDSDTLIHPLTPKSHTISADVHKPPPTLTHPSPDTQRNETVRHSFVNDSGQCHIYIEQVNVKRFIDPVERVSSAHAAQAIACNNPGTQYDAFSKEIPVDNLENEETQSQDVYQPLDENNPLVDEVTKLLCGNSKQTLEPKLMSATYGKRNPHLKAESIKRRYIAVAKKKCNLSMNKDPVIIGVNVPRQAIDKNQLKSRALKQLEVEVITDRDVEPKGPTDYIENATENKEIVMSIKCDQDGCVEEFVEKKEVVKNILGGSKHSDNKQNEQSYDKKENTIQRHSCHQKLGGHSIFERYLNEHQTKSVDSDICIGTASPNTVKSKDEQAVVYANTDGQKGSNTSNAAANKTDRHELREFLIFDDRQLQKKELFGHRQGLKSENKHLQEQIRGLGCMNSGKEATEMQKPEPVYHNMKTPAVDFFELEKNEQNEILFTPTPRAKPVSCASGNADMGLDAENFADRFANLGQSVGENIGSAIGAAGDTVIDVITCENHDICDCFSDPTSKTFKKKELPTFEEMKSAVENTIIDVIADNENGINDKNHVKKELPTFEELSEGAGYMLGDACGKLRDAAEDSFPYVQQIAERSMCSMKNFVSETVPRQLENMKEVADEQFPAIKESVSSTFESACQSCKEIIHPGSALSLSSSDSHSESETDYSENEKCYRESETQSSDSSSMSGYAKSTNSTFRTISDHILGQILSTFSRTSERNESCESESRKQSPTPSRVTSLIDTISKRVEKIEQADEYKQKRELFAIRKKIAEMDESIKRVYVSPPRAQEDEETDKEMKKAQKVSSQDMVEISPISKSCRKYIDMAKNLATGDSTVKSIGRNNKNDDLLKISTVKLDNPKTEGNKKSPLREKLDDCVKRIKNVFTIEDVVGPSKDESYRRISTTSVNENIIPLTKSTIEARNATDVSSVDDPSASNLSISSSSSDNGSSSSSNGRATESSSRSSRNEHYGSNHQLDKFQTDNKQSNLWFSDRQSVNSCDINSKNTDSQSTTIWQKMTAGFQSMKGNDNATEDDLRSLSNHCASENSYTNALKKSKKSKINYPKNPTEFATEHLGHLTQEYGDFGCGTIINCNHVIIAPALDKQDGAYYKNKSYQTIEQRVQPDVRRSLISIQHPSNSLPCLTKSLDDCYSSATSQSAKAVDSYNSHAKPIKSKSMISYISDNVGDMLTYNEDGYPKKELFGFRRTIKDTKAWLMDEKVLTSAKETDDELNSFSSIINDDSSDGEEEEEDDDK